MFIWGSHDALVPAGFSRHVRKWLPQAEQLTMRSCGHVPQVERPEECNALIDDFLARADRAEQIGTLKQSSSAQAA